MKNPVIKKNGKWFNTLTKRYVSESYAQRINSYFKRNPKTVLIRASGHGVLSYKKRKKASKETIELSKKKTILIKSKTLKGKNVYYSPKYNEVVSVSKKKISSIDYKNRMWIVSLYRKSLDGLSVYHILNYKIKMNLETELDANLYFTDFIKHVVPILRYELNKIVSNHIFSPNTVYIYGKLTSTVYSEIDYYPMNASFGFIPFNKKRYVSEFINILISQLHVFLNKLKSYSYHSLALEEMSIYISQSIKDVSHDLLKYREGVENINF